MPRTPTPYTGNVHLVQHGTCAHVHGRRVMFGTVAGYAMEKQQYVTMQANKAAELGITPEQLLARQVAHGILRTQAHNAKARGYDQHRMHWCNLLATCIHNNPAKYEADRAAELQWPHMAFGDRVVLEGCVYSLQPAPNDNVALEAVAPDPDTFYL